MTLTQRAHLQIAPIALSVATLAAVNGWLRPERAVMWLLAVGAMAGAWLAAAWILRRSCAKAVSERRFVVLAVVLAGLQIAAALAVTPLEAVGALDGEGLQRVSGVFAGLALAVLGNGLPKVLAPLAAKRYPPARAQALQRFAGWTFTLAGIGYAAASLLAAPDRAAAISMLMCGAAVLLVALRLAWAMRGPAPI